MDTLLVKLLESAPNLAVAIFAILYFAKGNSELVKSQGETARELIAHNRALVDKLIEFVTQREQLARLEQTRQDAQRTSQHEASQQPAQPQRP